MTISVDDVCTEAELDEYLGGALTKTINLLPGEWADSEPARAYALRRTLQALSRRSPPVFEQDVSDVTELHDAVVFGACARIYDLGITGAGESEVMFHQARRYEAKWVTEVQGLVLTGPTNERIASRAPAIFRR